MEDTIHLYGDDIGCVTLLNYMGDDRDIVNSARVSFNKDNTASTDLSDKDKRLIAYLAKNKHTSPFEHCSLTFRVTVPLFVARHHMRHRTWSFNEVSRRYTSDDLRFLCPKEFRTQHETNRQASTDDHVDPRIKIVRGKTQDYAITASAALEEHTLNALKLYQNLISSGICREQARMVLPQSMYTTYWCTANLLNVIKFLKLRLASDSQKEIQEMAQAMSHFVGLLYPEAYKACLETVLS